MMTTLERAASPHSAARISAPGAGDPFAALAGLARDLWIWLERAASRPGGAAAGELEAIAGRFRALAEAAPDAVLGALLLDQDAPYAQLHPLMVGLIADLVGRRAGLDPATRHVAMAAALSCNLGMLELQDALARQSAPLSEAQRAELRAHPLRSRDLLIATGVAEPLWLAIVVQHHERSDGSGYPAAMRAAEMPLAARLVALADMYAAMVLPRGYRDGLRAQGALREIFLARGGQVDEALAALFINELGVFPPGVFVRLANGETGVVVRRAERGRSRLLVSCYQSPRGAAYGRPILREAEVDGAFGVSEVLSRQPLPASAMALWGYGA